MPEYPRDLRGYGAHPPHPAWPGNARIAVQFVLNYEEGGESCILHGDPASEAFLSEIIGAAPWPGERHMSMESIYEYGARAGFWRLRRLFIERGLPVTVFGVASALARNPEAVAAMVEAGWEIASHGLRWLDYRAIPPDEEARHIAEAIRIQKALTGEPPFGFYQGRTSVSTLRLVQATGAFLYSADSYADDLPYWVEGPNGRGGEGPFLIMPYTLDANDMRFATPQGFNSGEQFFTYLRDAFDQLYVEGEHLPKLMSIGLHCRLAGRPGRALALARFLDHVGRHSGVLVATRLTLARHWIATHPPPEGFRPSRLSRALFLARFGDVFEHFPIIAERAFDEGLGAGADHVDGLHRAFIRVLEGLGAEAQMALIQAHPDLAGRLAAAGDLTAHSEREQASAGLDRLAPALRARFIELNAAYRARFGFPFILAVKGRSSAEILDAFESRLQNDADREFATALSEIGRIARARLEAVAGLERAG